MGVGFRAPLEVRLFLTTQVGLRLMSIGVSCVVLTFFLFSHLVTSIEVEFVDLVEINVLRLMIIVVVYFVLSFFLLPHLVTTIEVDSYPFGVECVDLDESSVLI